MSDKEKKPIEYVKYQQGDVVMYKMNDEDFKAFSNESKDDNHVDYEFWIQCRKEKLLEKQNKPTKRRLNVRRKKDN